MRRRHLLLLCVLAGCASPAGPPPTLGPVAVAPPAPAVTAPPAAAPIIPPTASGEIQFDQWAAEFQGRAVRAGVSPAVVAREMQGLTPDPRVASLDGRQPEFSKPVGDYIKGVVSADRIASGQRRRAEMGELRAIEQRQGVPPEILLAIWAMETNFGTIMGDMDVVRSMATLAAQGRRRVWAEGELIAALKIIEAGEFPRSRLRGSWAGAMGHTQFIPTSFQAMAVDGDGDGRRDVWGSSADGLASAANLLAKGGWRRGEAWAREVTVPAGFDYSLTEGPRQPPSWWAERGVRAADGAGWRGGDNGEAQLVAPAGAGGPLFLLFPNHFAIRKYNNSLAYALGVGFLADRFAGGGALARAWPVETPLALVDRMTAQRALAALGFDPGAPDGVVGMGTRSALRNWQKARGIVADGYLSPTMVQRLKSEAGV